ncbi:MAG: hypothetical protein EBR46_04875, partial [Betaproteobacteria bacterium]|nr:hypothetical protein [Betaproteobacteria bacterium]
MRSLLPSALLSVATVAWASAPLSATAQGSTQVSTPTDAKVEVKARGLVPLDDFFRRPEFSEAVLSPNGRYLATLSSINNRLNLVVIDLDTRQASVLTRYDNIDLGRLRWVG